jgi:hypothetical protein
MQKPDLAEMTNRTAINEGFHQQRTTGYVLSAQDIHSFQQCLQPKERDTEPRVANIISTNNGLPPNIRKLTSEELFSGNIIQITGARNIDNFLNLPQSAKEQLTQRGRTIVDLATLNEFYPPNYDKEQANEIGGQEERATLTQRL